MTSDNPDRPRIVLLDNEDTIRQILVQLLSGRGYQVYPFASKTEGLEWIVEIDPDLIISDLNSPGMTGFEFLTRIRENPATKDIPFVFYSGFDSRENRLSAFELGADDYLSKNPSFISHYLFTVIERNLRKRA